MSKLCTDETPLEEAPLQDVPQWYIKKLVAEWRRRHSQEEDEVDDETPAADWPPWRIRAWKKAKRFLQDVKPGEIPIVSLRDYQR